MKLFQIDENTLNFWVVTIPRTLPVLFLGCVFVSIQFYPGGNLLDHDQPGFDLTKNFLSELGGYESQSGQQNFLSAFFFNSSVFIFGLLGITFFFVPRLFRSDKITYLLAVFGSVIMVPGIILFALVGLTPHDLYRDEHIFVAMNAFRCIVPSTLLLLLAMHRESIPLQYLLVGWVFLAVNTCYVIFQAGFEDPTSGIGSLTVSAIFQKVIILLAMINMISFSKVFECLSKKKDKIA